MPEIYIILLVSYASIKLREEKRIFYFCPRKITVSILNSEKVQTKYLHLNFASWVTFITFSN